VRSADSDEEKGTMMFREIRRKKNALSQEAARELLRTNRRAALAVNGDNGYPYAIPINFYYEESENRIYFHGAKAGHKLDAILADPRVCLTTWDDGELEEGDWAYRVSSCVVFGKASIVEDREIAREKIVKFARKYYPTEEEIGVEMAAGFQAVHVFAIDIEHLSGKRVQEK